MTRFSGRLRPPLLLAAVLISASASAQVSYRYADWADGPVKFLMTKVEMKQWKTIHSDADAQAFIDLFWARRDPTPDTPRNEFRDEFDARVKIADDQFSNGRDRGAMTDRGRVFILLGPPYRVGGSGSQHAQGMTAPVITPQGTVSVPGPIGSRARQIWMYAHERKPKFIPRSDFSILFEDEGVNEWQLATTERLNPEIILQEAVNGLIVSPKLTKAPFATSTARARRTTFTDLLLDAAFKKFQSGDQTTIGPANLTWTQFVTPEGQNFVSAQLYAPAGSNISAGQKVTFFSVVENSAGQIVDVDEAATAMIASGGDVYVDKSVPLEPGSYAATFGLAADGRILSATRTTMKIEALDPAASTTSPLILSNNVYPLKEAFGPTDPFTFGGLKVVPKGDALFTPSGDLWYFVELRNPGTTEQGMPSITTQIDIEGSTPKGPVELRFPMKPANAAKLQGAKEWYAVGLAIPLEGFVPGDYTIKVRIVDTVLGKNYNLEKHFRVRGL